MELIYGCSSWRWLSYQSESELGMDNASYWSRGWAGLVTGLGLAVSKVGIWVGLGMRWRGGLGTGLACHTIPINVPYRATYRTAHAYSVHRAVPYFITRWPVPVAYVWCSYPCYKYGNLFLTATVPRKYMYIILSLIALFVHSECMYEIADSTHVDHTPQCSFATSKLRDVAS